MILTLTEGRLIKRKKNIRHIGWSVSLQHDILTRNEKCLPTPDDVSQWRTHQLLWCCRRFHSCFFTLASKPNSSRSGSEPTDCCLLNPADDIWLKFLHKILVRLRLCRSVELRCSSLPSLKTSLCGRRCEGGFSGAAVDRCRRSSLAVWPWSRSRGRGNLPPPWRRLRSCRFGLSGTLVRREEAAGVQCKC